MEICCFSFAGADVDCMNHLGQTALFVACYLRDRRVVRLLLRFGADPNSLCFGGYTPTHGALFSGSTRIIKMILEAGGNLDTQDCWRQTPM